MPNGVILKYSVVLERYKGGPIIDSRNLDGNVFTTMFTDNQALGKLHDCRVVHVAINKCTIIYIFV